MHAAVEEVDLDPCDLYTDLGTLIIEGRVPGLTDKGFGEGPHCPSTHGQNRHQCDPSSTECQKYEQILKHMLLLWKNGIPMTIEVLLYPSCCAPAQNVDSVPETSYILLEQWTIHMLPRRMSDANISPRGLIQAVRSFLYFSQLCAWFSLTGGKSPENVHYRICVPGEAFSSKFCSQPDSHRFPITNIGRNAAMKVQMKCHPRCGEIPVVPCHKHSQPNLPLKVLKGRTEEFENLDSCSVREYAYDGILPSGFSSRTSSPADSMLGESLLDPPNSLCMYTKRYQSPSRCGSPSIEVPEHLMFGKKTVKQEELSPPRRSRPQRRPVVERFLKKNLGDDLSSSDVASWTFDKKHVKTKENAKSDILSLKSDVVLNYCCIEDCMKQVPREEMEQVLERLRDRHCVVKCSHENPSNLNLTDVGKRKNMHHKSLCSYVEELKINSPILEHNRESTQNAFLKRNEIGDSKHLFKQALRLNKESSNNRKNCDRNCKTISSIERLSPEILNPRIQHCTDSQFSLKQSHVPNHLLTNKLNLFQSPGYSEHRKNESNLLHTIKEKTDSTIQNLTQESSDHQFSKAYHSGDRTGSHMQQIHPKLSTVNIKKYGAFLPKSVIDELSDEREILSDSSEAQPLSSDGNFGDEAFSYFPAVPSAEKKALFRRSLDSATNLVFHQRSGLPLTSSPAPIRKCGTRFDFDSSLTSVSAIKRAFFEKEPETKTEEQEKVIQLSNSAPASIFSSSLLGTFEESVLNGRLEPVSTVEGFTAEIGASGSFCPRHVTLPVTVFFYTLQDMDKVTSPYMGHINLRDKDYHVPKRGTVQVTLFNPHRTVVKMFVVRYDLSDMPVNCQTFLRQRTLYMPSDASEIDPDAQKWLRYLIHLRFMSSKSGRIYLHTDIRVIIFRKSDLDAATVHGQRPYELRSFTHGPLNPKFSPHKP
ncbi:protein FAM214A-like isoform X2 [Stegodyphus dumicola]|nr:protein FAM214A-like isoform X2 [Stegodyphus dumicola]XP_035205925.1 protein FAM214A-like isoform X2 [Stegodyphus dumicola]XP_035205926.1 protein FAM214A-like isoform X2 [Stegodyphus dumicola]XP_035205927.1 protein FAM214A-like isoform X2 [Stegodyphus dumicola]